MPPFVVVDVAFSGFACCSMIAADVESFLTDTSHISHMTVFSLLFFVLGGRSASHFFAALARFYLHFAAILFD